MTDFFKDIWHEEIMDLLFECSCCPAVGEVCQDCSVHLQIERLKRPEGAVDE